MWRAWVNAEILVASLVELRAAKVLVLKGLRLRDERAPHLQMPSFQVRTLHKLSNAILDITQYVERQPPLYTLQRTTLYGNVMPIHVLTIESWKDITCAKSVLRTCKR